MSSSLHPDFPIRPGPRILIAGTILVLLTGCQQQAAPDLDTPASLSDQLSEVRAGQRELIELTGKAVHDKAIEPMRNVQGVTRVVIEQSELSAAGLAVLATIPELEQLVIRGKAVDDEGLSELVSSQNLRVLNLPRTTISRTTLEKLQQLPRLMLLRIGSPHLEDDCLQVITGMPAIRFLHLIDIPITDQGLRHLYDFEQLESLYLDGARVSGEGVSKLMEKLPRLHLHLDQHHHDRDPNHHEHADGAGRG
jgi:hypothetical protein